MINNTVEKHIPVFFSTDDNYAPYLEVAIRSLITNASKEFKYRIVVLNTGLDSRNIAKIKENECAGFAIDFVDISEYVEEIKSRLKNVYHFSVATYYRIFIATLFPQYKKIVYLDCDIVVLGDISELYFADMKDNILAAVTDGYVSGTLEFRNYAETAIGVDPDEYINAGVLVIDLEEFRKNRIEEKFVRLITEYDFDLLDPDQAYLNYLCRGKIHILPGGWNKEPVNSFPADGKKIVHYALYKKPWQYDDVVDGEFFWHYAKGSPFYRLILQRKAGFGAEEMAKGKLMAKEILEHANAIVRSDYTFAKMLNGR